jgi:hypothetical protein
MPRSLTTERPKVIHKIAWKLRKVMRESVSGGRKAPRDRLESDSLSRTGHRAEPGDGETDCSDREAGQQNHQGTW